MAVQSAYLTATSGTTGVVVGSGTPVTIITGDYSYTYWNGDGLTTALSNPANWINGLPAADTELDFGPLATGGSTSPNNDSLAWSSTTSAAGLRFVGSSDWLQGGVNSAAYTLTGLPLVLTGAINNDSTNDQVINIPITLAAGAGVINSMTNNMTFNAVISGSSGIGLTKQGAGTAVLAAANTYAGSTVIQGGALEADDGVGLPATTNLAFNGGVLQSHDQMTTFSRPLGSGTGAVQWTGDGGFAVRNAMLTVNIASGSSDPLVWNSTPYFLTNGNVLLFGSNTSNNVVNFQNSIDLNGAARTVQVTAGAGGDYTILSGVLSDSSPSQTGGLTKTGAGLLVLTNTNTYSGATTISGGALQADDGLGLPTASPLVLNGGVLQNHGSTTFTRPLGYVSGEVQWTAMGGFSAAGNDLTVNIGGHSPAYTLAWGTGGFASTGLLFGSASADHTVIWTNPINLGSNAVTIQVDPGVGTAPKVNMQGNLTSASGGSLTKTGSGTLLLSGSNTYTGPTTIDQGKLDVDGWLTNSAVTVNSGGILSGTGSLASVTVNAGGTLTPGDSLGILHLSGNLILESGAEIDYGLDGNPADNEVAMPAGVLTLDDQQFSDFNFMFLAGFRDGTYTLIDAGSISGSLGSNLSGAINGHTATLAVQGNNLVLNVVPEPSSLVLLAAGAIGLLGYGWRRRRAARRVAEPMAFDRPQDGPTILCIPSRRPTSARRAA